MPAYGSCCLSSLNLSEFIENPFTKLAYVNYAELAKATQIAVIGMNEVLMEGLIKHPLKEQQETVGNWRQIGLGTLGLHDALIKQGIVYGSPKSLEVIESIYKCIASNAVIASLELAKEKGCYKYCDKKKLIESTFIKALNLPDTILQEISTYGLFNSQILTCAPTGSIATMLEASSGVEPHFALSYNRRTLSLDGKESIYKVEAKIVQDYKHFTKIEDTLPDYFISSADIVPTDRIKVQAILQKYIDASISSTINLPKNTTVKDVENIYMDAWKNGLKGVTVYRTGCKREGILTLNNEKPVDILNTKAPKRPKELPADFHIVKAKGKQFIVLVGLFNDRPYEVWAFEPNVTMDIATHKGVITKKSKMHYSFKSPYLQIDELELANENVEEKSATLYASMLLRHGIDIKYIIKIAKKVNDNITSFSSAMCRVLSKYIPSEVTGEQCPECGGETIRESGCVHCKNCGWSKCG